MKKAFTLWIAAVGGLAAIAIPATALASGAMGAWADVRSLEFKPNEAAANQVIIHGAFALWNSSTTTGWNYTDPKVGFMNFKCPSGSEATCRMQWKDLKATITTPIDTKNCAGFGENYKPPGSVYNEGSPSSPDTWVLGVGVLATPYAGGTCAKLKAALGGAGDAGPDVGPDDTGPADTGSLPTDSGSTAADTGSAPAAAPPSSKSGCSIAAPSSLGASFGWGVGLGALALAIARRRRRA